MRLLKGAWDAWKLSWQLACGVLFPGLSSSTREPPRWGKLRADEVPISGFQACNSLRFDLQTRIQRSADNRESPGGERS
jgi:hypothetical protein